MNLTPHNSTGGAAPQTNAGADPRSNAASAEDTLRLIARLSAPAGLEDRLMAGLHSPPRRGRLLQWPAILHPGSSWMRSAAAAAIVLVVAGGGWGIYTRVQPAQPAQPAKLLVMPRAGAGSGFSSAGAMRTPQTLQGPVVAEPVASQSAIDKTDVAQPVLVKPLKKAPAKVVPMTTGRAKASALNKQTAEPTVSIVK
jgi:hypothetical protein